MEGQNAHHYPTFRYNPPYRLEPITHFLTGACLGRAGLNRKTALATLTLTLAAEAPDLDVLSGLGGAALSLAAPPRLHSPLPPQPARCCRGSRLRLSDLAPTRPQVERSQPPAALGTPFSLRLPRRPQPHPARLHQQLRCPPLLALLRALVF